MSMTIASFRTSPISFNAQIPGAGGVSRWNCRRSSCSAMRRKSSSISTVVVNILAASHATKIAHLSERDGRSINRGAQRTVLPCELRIFRAGPDQVQTWRSPGDCKGQRSVKATSEQLLSAAPRYSNLANLRLDSPAVLRGCRSLHASCRFPGNELYIAYTFKTSSIPVIT